MSTKRKADDGGGTAGKKGKAGRKKHAVYNDAEADITLVSSDVVEFKVQRFYLQAMSSVFRDMLQACTPGSGPIMMTDEKLERAVVLALLFDLAYQKPFTSFYKQECGDVLDLIHLAYKYDCPNPLVIIRFMTARRVRPKDEDMDSHFLFYYACALDDLESAHYLLPIAAALEWPAYSEVDSEDTAIFDEDTEDVSVLDIHCISTKWIERLPDRYWRALLRASSCLMDGGVWGEVADEFKRLIKLTTPKPAATSM